MEFNNLDTLESYWKLQQLYRQDLWYGSPEAREMENLRIDSGGGLTYYYGAKLLSEKTLQTLEELAEEQQLIAKYRLLLSGDIMNTGENRMVLHHLLRGEPAGKPQQKIKEYRNFYLRELEKLETFCENIHRGKITGSTGKAFDTVVQIGIGGSDLGPRALYLALENLADQQGFRKMKAHFISNVDPDDAASVLQGVNPETTLFILVSKSGTTQETLVNRRIVLEHLQVNASSVDPKKHFLAVTSKSSPLASSEDILESFYIDDYIGGRYSSTSCVGGTVLSLAYGFDTFRKLLSGAAEADKKALEPRIQQNAALTDALTGIFERNILGYRSTALLPYSQALLRFPAHLQQLDMESNGKQVNRRGEPVSYPTGPVVFGEPGTNGQHSFYQLLHQGTDIIPLQFIGFKESQRVFPAASAGAESQKALLANLAAQIAAFTRGRPSKDGNKNFPGGRPAGLLLGKRLTPEALGALLAHYENKIMFQGFCWNINSFDQEGVQLGKVLAGDILAGKTDDSLLKSLSSVVFSE
ncbi:MAG: glucose-6-phosphate isomerase [Spirochaetales bacterium]|nr:glucose-6-phosphate isomerase [Spirochaetales bacterium]